MRDTSTLPHSGCLLGSTIAIGVMYPRLGIDDPEIDSGGGAEAVEHIRSSRPLVEA